MVEQKTNRLVSVLVIVYTHDIKGLKIENNI